MAGLLLAGTVAVGFAVLPAVAEPVWVSGPGTVGQGYTFKLNGRCFAYTAGHVIKSRDAEVTLTDVDGYSAPARVVKQSTEPDLALVEVTGPPSKYKELCVGHLPKMVRLDRLFQRPKASKPDLWLDTIESSAGGWTRREFFVAEADALKILWLTPRKAKLGAAEAGTFPGNSGASVWLSEQETIRARYDRDGNPKRTPFGLLAGIHLGVQDGRAYAAASPTLHEFIFDHLQPVRWQNVRISPADVRIIESRRGTFPAEDKQHVIEGSDSELDHLAYEFDFGDEERRLVGVRVSLRDTTRGIENAKNVAPNITLASSQFRPAERKRPDWKREKCEEPRLGRKPFGPSVECSVANARIVRGLRMEFTGNPSSVESIALEFD